MPYYRRKRRFFWARQYVMRAFLGGIGLTMLGWLWWWLATIGPKAVDPDRLEEMPVETAERSAELRELTAAVQAKLRAHEERNAADDFADLVEAISIQRELTLLAGPLQQKEAQFLAELEERLADLEAQGLNERILAAEAAGQLAFAAERFEDASREWDQALRWQRKINRSPASARVKNFVREAQLDKHLREIDAAPLAAEVAAAVTRARAAMADERWGDALMAFAAAREGQSRLNGEFGRTRYANTMLLTEIERDIESLDAAGLAGEVDDAEAAARAALAAGDSQAAADAFAEARMLQLEVNREYARSRFVSSARVEALEVERQSAASLPLVTNLSEADDAISFLLVRRETAKAAERIVLANAQVGELFELLPKSRHLDADLRLKLTYLNSQRERLREIQDAVYDRVRPLPGASELRMLQTEFPQALFQQVMKTNPSRNPGRAYPVDSVSWFDATECCRRLSWILGLPVRLPTADEFRVAVGDAAEHTVPEDQHARTDRSREMAARSANAAGFFDLLGNLAEWLDAPESQLGGAPAIVAGGSYLDGVETLRTVPLAELARAERGRHIGFRVVLATER